MLGLHPDAGRDQEEWALDDACEMCSTTVPSTTTTTTTATTATLIELNFGFGSC